MIGKNSPCWCGSGKKYKHCHEEWDNTINVLKLQGKIVPSHNLIKSEEDIKWIKKAAKINNAVLDLVGEKICAGMTTEEIDNMFRTAISGNRELNILMAGSDQLREK